MDDLLSLDFNFLDDDLLSIGDSFPMDDEFNPIESREIESILNEIEQSTNEKLFNVPNTFLKPTIMFNSNNKNSLFNNAKLCSKKSKSKIGTSLLAKPPKKLKKDKNSLLRTNSNGLLANRMTNLICKATFTAYFYQDHNYCFNSTKLQQSELDKQNLKEENIFSKFIDLNNNDAEFKFDNLTIETKEVVIESSEEEISKKKSLTNSTSFNLISPNNLFNNSCGAVHDLDDYFNISFSCSEGTDSTHHSETEDDFNRFDLENEIDQLTSKTVTETKELIDNCADIKAESKVDKNGFREEEKINERKSSELIDSTQLSNNKSLNQSQVDNQGRIAANEATETETSTKIEKQEAKNVLIDDINNYNINEINDTDNELISLEDEDDILIETDILIDEMFGDFAEYDLISKKSKLLKNSANKKTGNRNVIKNQSSKTVLNTASRRSRTISNSYSVRSSSSCSCCSDDSEEDQPNKHDELTKRVRSNCNSNIKLSNRRSTSKLIKGDNAFIKKKNNGRFLMHKNSSF